MEWPRFALSREKRGAPGRCSRPPQAGFHSLYSTCGACACRTGVHDWCPGQGARDSGHAKLPRKSPKSLPRGIGSHACPSVYTPLQETSLGPPKSPSASVSLRPSGCFHFFLKSRVLATHWPDHPNNVLHLFVVLQQFLDNDVLPGFTWAWSASGTEELHRL